MGAGGSLYAGGRPPTASMHRIAFLAALLPALAFAQEAEQANPLGLTQAVGYPWVQVSQLVPPPDGGTVDDGAGDLFWTAPDPNVSRLDVAVRSGAVYAVTTTTPDNTQEMAALVNRFAAAMGEPADGEFYTAAQFREVNPQSPHLDVRVDPEAGTTTLRLPDTPPPAAPGQ